MPKFSLVTTLIIGAVCALFILVALTALANGNPQAALGAGLFLAVIGFVAWTGRRLMRWGQTLQQLPQEQQQQAAKRMAKWVAAAGVLTLILKIIAMRGHA